MVNLQKVVELVLRLCLTRNLWTHREISALDFGADESLYEQKFTIDVNVSRVRKECNTHGLKHMYIPIYWRPKGPMYSMNCRSADGRTLQILNREFNEKFSEDFFWALCKVHFKGDLPMISENLKNFVRDGVRSTAEEAENYSYPSNYLNKSDKDTWDKLMKDVVIRDLWKTILECHIVVVRVPKQADGSIIKLSEIKNFELMSASRFKLNPFSPVVKINCNIPTVRRVKILVPKDVRITLCTAGKNGDIIKMNIFGDGHWARYDSSIGSRGSSNWNIYLSPRRSELLVPGLVLSIIALISCLFWWHLESRVSVSGIITDNVLFAFMLTILPVLAGAVLSRSSSSYIYRRATGRYVWRLLVMSTLWFAFTALPVSYSHAEPLPLVPATVSPAIVSIVGHIRVLFIVLIYSCLLLFVTAIVASTERIASFFISTRNRLIRFMLQLLQSWLTE